MDTINDMTEGRVSKKILGFFFPLLWANLLQQLYSVADTAIVGKGIGDNALAAVGIISAVSLLIIGFSMGLTNGFSVVIAQSCGLADGSSVRKTVRQSVRLCAVIAVILTAVSLLFLRPILLAMHTDETIMGDALSYGRIIFGGLSVTVAYNLCSGVLRAMGDSKTPFKAILISSALNILLDMLMIFVLGTGVRGAAAATVSAQLVSVMICTVKIRKLTITGGDEESAVSDREIRVLLLKNGLPMAFMNSLTAVGCMIVQAYINTFGVDYTSAYSVCTKYLNLFMLPSITAGFSISAFTGQNFGAKRFDRIRAGVRTGLLISFVSYIILGAAMNIFPTRLAQLMLSGDRAVAFTADYLRILGYTLIGVSFIFIFRNAVQGMGCPSVPMISGILEMVLRMAAIFILMPRYDFTAAAFADAIAWAGALALNMAAYFVILRRRSK